MIRFRHFIERATVIGRVDLSNGKEDEVSASDLKRLEKYLDDLFEKIGMDVEFTKHFLDRVNDTRNEKQITIPELRNLFQSAFQKYKNQFVKFGDKFQAVLKDTHTDINIPFVLQWDSKKGEMDLVSKTVMRKKNFKTPNKELKV